MLRMKYSMRSIIQGVANEFRAHLFGWFHYEQQVLQNLDTSDLRKASGIKVCY